MAPGIVTRYLQDPAKAEAELKAAAKLRIAEELRLAKLKAVE